MYSKTRAIVLKNTNYSESSIISKIYTREFGIQTYILRGVRKGKSKIRASMIQPLSLVELDVYQKPNTSINNIKDLNKTDSIQVNKLINKFSLENDPIKIYLSGKHISTLYYGNSNFLNKLKYYPLALLLIAALFGFIAFLFFKSTKISEMNLLWSGMAKEL